MTDFGGGHGKAALMTQWKLDQPARSGLWKELKTILRLGCVYQRGVWLMPSFGDQLEVQLDPLTTLIAIDPVPLRRAPRADAAAIAQLDWHVLRFHELAGGDRWVKVSVRDGRAGYVRKEHVRSLLDNRMTVSRVGRQLKITALVAGD
jgi:hypothetical protein